MVEKKKSHQLLIVLIIIFVILFGIGITASVWYWQRTELAKKEKRSKGIKEEPKSPTPNKESYIANSKVSDEYIIGIVGEAEFKKNYGIDEQESIKNNSKKGLGIEYYKFAPAIKYDSNNHFFFIDNNKVTSTSITQEKDIATELPSCEKDENKCNFKLDYSKFREIILKNKPTTTGYKEQVFIVMYNGEVVAKVDYSGKKIIIDLQDGDILWAKNKTQQFLHGDP